MYSDRCLFDQKFPNENEFSHNTFEDDLIMDENNVYEMFEKPQLDPNDLLLEQRALQEVPLYQLNDMHNRYNANQLNRGNILYQNQQIKPTEAKNSKAHTNRVGQIVQQDVHKPIMGRKTLHALNSNRNHQEQLQLRK